MVVRLIVCRPANIYFTDLTINVSTGQYKFTPLSKAEERKFILSGRWRFQKKETLTGLYPCGSLHRSIPYTVFCRR